MILLSNQNKENVEEGKTFVVEDISIVAEVVIAPMSTSSLEADLQLILKPLPLRQVM